MKVPFGKPIVGEEEVALITEVLDSGILVHGSKTETFEEEFKALTQCANAISVSSCTAGLHLLYFALGIGPGDEVIVPAQTHVATVHAVELVGATPVFVDCSIEDGNVEYLEIGKHINNRTKAVSVVHFLGYPARVDKIAELCDANSIHLIEDCALAIGSKINGKHVGTFGTAGVFSFYPVKHSLG